MTAVFITVTQAMVMAVGAGFHSVTRSAIYAWLKAGKGRHGHQSGKGGRWHVNKALFAMKFMQQSFSYPLGELAKTTSPENDEGREWLRNYQNKLVNTLVEVKKDNNLKQMTIEDLLQKVHLKHDKLEVLEYYFAVSTEKHQRATLKIAELQSEMKELRETLKATEKKLAKRDREIKKERKEKRQAQTKFVKANGESYEYFSELCKLREKHENLSQEYSDLNDLYEDATKWRDQKIESLEQELQSTPKSLSEAKEKSEQQQQQIEQITKDNNQILTDLEDQKQECTDLTEKVQKLESERSRYTSQYQEASIKIEEMKADRELLLFSLEGAGDDILLMQKQIAKTEKEKSELESENSTLKHFKKIYTQACADKIGLRQKCNDLKKQNKYLEKQLFERDTQWLMVQSPKLISMAR